jgi:uncharacterized membrane protein
MNLYELIPSADKARHALKSLSYRIYSSCITTAIATLVTGNNKLALAIGSTDFIVKLFTYYFHERVWYRIPFGLQVPRKIHTEIGWIPTDDSFRQITFLQYEEGSIRKRAKILANKGGQYVAVLSLYNKKSKTRYTDIINTNSLQELEDKLKIKIEHE